MANGINLVEYYSAIYEGKIRPVDEKWVESQRAKYENCPGYMNFLAQSTKKIVNSYSPNKSLDSKRTFVLWKKESICSVLFKYGYCSKKQCAHCPVYEAVEKQLEEIDLEIDAPTGGNPPIQAHAHDGRIIFDYHGKKIQVLIEEGGEKDE